MAAKNVYLVRLQWFTHVDTPSPRLAQNNLILSIVLRSRLGLVVSLSPNSVIPFCLSLDVRFRKFRYHILYVPSG